MSPDGEDKPVSSMMWDDVQVGDVLPNLRMPITQKTLALAVAGTRDFMPYHHNSAFARSVGSRDAFVNTMFNQGLLGRYVTDWTGPDSNLVSQTLQMTDQLCLGDVGVVEGRVVEVWRDAGQAYARLDIVIRAGELVTARSTTVVAMPSTAHGPVPVPSLGPREETAVSDEVPDEVRERLNVVRKRTSPYPVSEAQIAYWCEMVRDANPLYEPGALAPGSRYGGQIAPPTMLMTWGMPRGTQTGVQTAHPDVEDPASEPWPGPPSTEVGGYRISTAKEIIGVSTVSEFGAPVRPGDHITIGTALVACSPARKTKLGWGHFVTNVSEFRAEERLVGRVTITTLHYGVPAPEESSRSTAAESKER
nr:MaoC family dehydratase N-terminal domain-containing protein [Rhodococcus wratislaviensis]GLK33189.1 hypothetical protein GCM10017611_00310 [Rhodococcus wratislaviensis]